MHAVAASPGLCLGISPVSVANSGLVRKIREANCPILALFNNSREIRPISEDEATSFYACTAVARFAGTLVGPLVANARWQRVRAGLRSAASRVGLRRTSTPTPIERRQNLVNNLARLRLDRNGDRHLVDTWLFKRRELAVQ